MGSHFDEIPPELADWILQQHVFFVATAPLAADGLVNLSPKGLDTFRLLGPREAAYLDLTGSGVETIAHLRENGRIVLMFCAFDGPPKIVRLYGTGDVIVPDMPEYESLRPQFPDVPGARAIIRVRLNRVSSTCGYAVPLMDYVGERDALIKWAVSKGDAGLREYQAEKNARSLDGLAGLVAED